MASSKKLPLSNPLLPPLKTYLVGVFKQHQLVKPTIHLALSGGLDSCVLLHLLHTCQQTLPFQLHAHHVHHGLSPNADAWADFCVALCQSYHVPLTLSKVFIHQNSGLGIEATARQARYDALLSADTDFICLAHHQDDQAETLLLQLARGAGVKGLSGMAHTCNKLPRTLLRPLLQVPRSALEVYAKACNLAWVEDESNADTQYDRNFMRHDILPILAKKYPSIRQTISRAAHHMAQASGLLDELAQQDIQIAQVRLQQLNLAPLQQLSAGRINNAIRWWLQIQACDAPSTAQLQQICTQLCHAKSDANLQIKVSASHTLRRFQGSAYLVKNVQEGDDVDDRSTFRLLWQSEEVMILPDQSRLLFSQQIGKGIALRHLAHAHLLVRYRQGGERLKPELHRPSRGLKSVLQMAEMPPWQRERLPLVWLNDALVVVPNIALDVRFAAEHGELGLVVHWQDY